MKPIQSWSDLTLEHLVYAYRKAKADCYFERVANATEGFVDFEADLATNLNSLLKQLQSGRIRSLLVAHVGEPRVFAKKLSLELSKDEKKLASSAHMFFSEPQRAFDAIKAKSELVPEFRLVGHFSPEMHILSALWVNTVGHKFDASLSSSAYGSRLRRYRSAAGSPKGELGEYHLEAIGSFQPYFDPYKKWRENGLKAIRRELEDEQKNEQSVIAISFDISSYYHNIDPSFAANRGFHNAAGFKLTDWEQNFTKAFVDAFQLWALKARTRVANLNASRVPSRHIGGIPIGLSFAHVIANALLISLDRDIKEGLTPIYYGRYVDDMFLVLRDPGNIKNVEELIEFIAKRTKRFDPQKYGSKITIKLPKYAGRTNLVLQKNKQKTFFLNGRGGLDLLDSIETQIRSVSSERRLMPSVDKLDSTASAKVLTAAGQASEEADTLRRADGLAVRRLSWSVQLRSIEILARDLKREDWRKERTNFYEFAYAHILRPDKILDHIDYLPRLLSIAVSLADWADAKRLYDTALRALEDLRKTKIGKIRINGAEVNYIRKSSEHEAVWKELESVMRSFAKDAVLKSLRWKKFKKEEYMLPEAAKELCKSIQLETDPQILYRVALSYREADLAKTPYREHLRKHAKDQRKKAPKENILYSKYSHFEKLNDFLQSTQNTESHYCRINKDCSQSNGSLLPYIFPTRPYTTQEISLLLPNACIFNKNSHHSAYQWATYVRAVRGIWVWDKQVNDERLTGELMQSHESDATHRYVGKIAYLGEHDKKDKVLLGITSLKTTDATWVKAASGKPDLSRERYTRIERLVNQAISSHPKPKYLLLPELSLPEQWIETISSLLLDEGISLIAGLDYHHKTKPKEVYSEAVMVLTDNRLGFPSSVQIRQEKTSPSAEEEIILPSRFGSHWKSFKDDSKPLYIHHGFCFAVLICSELQNMRYRHELQGHVDSLMVLSWNKDLETFSALIESASLDVHAHIALVNNRQYGDSRVRIPSKKFYRRDLCRLRGGENEYVVVVELDVEELRSFQSRALRDPKETDPYKPVPEGFKIGFHREATPK